MAPRKTAARKTPPSGHVYRLVVRLQSSEPAVWRLLSVPGRMTLADVNRVILAAMGWTHSHLHLFTIEGQLYGLPDDEWPEDKPLLPDGEHTLAEVLGTEVRHFVHEYDFGDGWEHDVSIQAIEYLDEQRNGWPMCLAGGNACPPEDVGGLGGYADFLEAITDPSHDEHIAMWRWNGGPFDPEGFDINAANREIRDVLAQKG